MAGACWRTSAALRRRRRRRWPSATCCRSRSSRRRQMRRRSSGIARVSPKPNGRSRATRRRWALVPRSSSTADPEAINLGGPDVATGCSATNRSRPALAAARRQIPAPSVGALRKRSSRRAATSASRLATSCRTSRDRMERFRQASRSLRFGNAARRRIGGCISPNRAARTADARCQTASGPARRTARSPSSVPDGGFRRASSRAGSAAGRAPSSSVQSFVLAGR